MEFRGKKLLILAGQGVHCKVVEAAKEMGVYTIVTDYLENSPAKKIADESLMLNITDVDGIVEYCKANNVDGVINFCNDLASKVQYQICERLGLPCIGNEKQVLAFTNKAIFKDYCVKNGVDIIPSYTEQEAVSGQVDFPVLVKPVDSRGSRGIQICNNQKEVAESVKVAKNESATHSVTIEKYMKDKQDFSMTYLIKNSIPYLVRTADRYLGKEEDGLQNQCAFSISPSRFSKLFLNNVNNKFCNLIKSVGIQNAPVFVQGFIDGGTIRFYDPGIRFPGADYERLLDKATGINVMKQMIAYCLGGEIDDYNGNLGKAYELNGYCSLQMMIACREGTIAEFNGFDEIEGLEGVVYVARKACVGTYIPASGDVKQRVAEIVMMVKDDEDSIKAIVKKVQSFIDIRDTNNQNMVVSLIDVDRVQLTEVNV